MDSLLIGITIIALVGIAVVMSNAFAEKLDQLDGAITPTGCDVIKGKILDAQVNLLKTRVCYYNNYKFLITFNPHLGCIWEFTQWTDSNNNTFSFNFCDKPNPIKNIRFGNFFSPLKQLKLGVPENQINCVHKNLIIKKSSHVPACVNAETAQKLVERGWAVYPRHIDSQVESGNTTPFSQVKNGDLALSIETDSQRSRGGLINVTLTVSNNGPNQMHLKGINGLPFNIRLDQILNTWYYQTSKVKEFFCKVNGEDKNNLNETTEISLEANDQVTFVCTYDILGGKNGYQEFIAVGNLNGLLETENKNNGVLNSDRIKTLTLATKPIHFEVSCGICA